MEITIDKWYGKEKTDLINKNTIDKVEFLENNTAVVGGNVYAHQLWLWEKTTDKDFADAGFSSMTTHRHTGKNLHTGWGDSIETREIETLGDATIKFPNLYGDSSAANYAITARSCYMKNGQTSFIDFEFLKGSLVNPETEQSESIASKVSLAFSGNDIILSIKDLLLYGDYFVKYKDNPQYDEQRNFRPWYYTIIVVYGGLQTTNEKITYGAGENSMSFESNGLIEKHTTINGKTIAEDMSSRILAAYKNGKQTVALKVLCDKFYDNNGNLVIDLNSKSENVKQLIEIGDIFFLKKRGKSLYNNADGSPKKFLVTTANLHFEGKPTMDIEGVEI